MHDLVKAMASASGGMRAQSMRLRLVAENIANVDTPGYRRKLVSFEPAVEPRSQAATVRAGPVTLSQEPGREVWEPGHPLADGRGIVTFSNVETLIEMADAREAQRSYQAGLNAFDQARRMYAGLVDLLRR